MIYNAKSLHCFGSVISRCVYSKIIMHDILTLPLRYYTQRSNVDTSFPVNAINYIAVTIFEYFHAAFLARSDGTRDTAAGLL